MGGDVECVGVVHDIGRGESGGCDGGLGFVWGIWEMVLVVDCGLGFVVVLFVVVRAR